MFSTPILSFLMRTAFLFSQVALSSQSANPLRVNGYSASTKAGGCVQEV